MAVSAKFVADFSSFFAAVQKANVELKGLETGAGRVEKSLNKIADEFSGRKVIQDATLMAEAINRIGGATTLTDAEMRKVNATITEAINKYKALGQEAPKALTDLAAATKRVADNTANIPGPTAQAGAAFKTLFGGFTAANLAANLISKLATEVGNLAEKGLKLPAIEQSFERLTASIHQDSGEMLSSLQTATKGMVSQFDLMQTSNKALLLGLPVTKESMQDMATAATALGRAMGEDTTKALDDLITALGRSSPMILDNLGLTVKVGEANEAYAKKLGKTAEQLTDAEKKTAFYEAAMEAARKKTKELGDQSLTLSEIMSRTWTSVGNVVTQAAGQINVGAGAALSSWEKFLKFVNDANQSGTAVALMRAAREEQERLAEAAKKASFKDFNLALPVDPLKAYAAELAKLRTTAEKLTPAQQALVKEAVKLGQSAADIAKGMNLSEKAVTAYIKTTEAAEAAEKKHREELDRNTKAAVELGRKSAQAFHEWNLEITKAINQSSKGIVSDQMKRGLAELHDRLAAVIIDLQHLNENAHIDEAFSFDPREFQKAPEFFEQLKKDVDATNAAMNRLNREGLAGFRDGLQLLARIGGNSLFGNVVGGLSDTVDLARSAAHSFDILGTAGVSTAAKIGAGVSAAASVVGVAFAAQQAVSAILAKIDKDAGLEAEQFLRASGQLRDLNLQLKLAGVNAQQLFAIKDERTFQAAFEGAKRQIDETNAALERYGLTWKDFSKVTQEFVDNRSRDLVSMWDRFTKAGVDAEKLIKGMSGDLSQLVIDAKQTGTKISASLRPMLEQLIRTKQLSEDAAAALLGIEREGTPAFSDIKDAAERYGIELDSLGDRVKGIEITDLATQIGKDFKFLTGAGADTNAVLKGMQDEVQKVVSEALRLGIKLPESMRPVIQAMIDAGLLTDQFGNKLTNVSGIEFEQPLTDKIDDLISAIRDLIDETIHFGDEAVYQFNRARNGAEILGHAIPRDFAPGGSSGGGTATPRPGTEIPAPPVPGGTAVPRPGGTGTSEDFPTPEVGPFDYASVARAANSLGSGMIIRPLPVSLELDGVVVAEQLVPLIPGVVDRYGV